MNKNECMSVRRRDAAYWPGQEATRQLFVGEDVMEPNARTFGS